jgi:hypothetical protein
LTVLASLWNRLVRHRNEAAVERSIETQQMSSAERRFVEEGAEDRQAEAHTEEWLGGIDPERFLDGQDPPRD